jgi:hypothetical protein
VRHLQESGWERARAKAGMCAGESAACLEGACAPPGIQPARLHALYAAPTTLLKPSPVAARLAGAPHKALGNLGPALGAILFHCSNQVGVLLEGRERRVPSARVRRGMCQEHSRALKPWRHEGQWPLMQQRRAWQAGRQTPPISLETATACSLVLNAFLLNPLTSSDHGCRCWEAPGTLDRPR